MRSLALSRALPFLAVTTIPFLLMSCSSDDQAPSNSGGATSGTTGGSGGVGPTGTGGSTPATGGTLTGGTPATGGSSPTGGTAGQSASTGGSPAGGAGAGGQAAAGGGAMGGGGTSAGGMGGGGMGGTTSGGADTMGGAGVGGMSGGASGVGGGGGAGAPAGGASGGASGGEFTLTSPTHEDGAHFDAAYTCAANNGQFGAGVNPELNWSGVPDGTKSFAMTFIDTTLGEDSAMGQHWAIWNIPWDSSSGAVSQIPEGTTMLTGDLMGATQSRTFLTPCAQSLMNNMDDEYAFTIYALSTDTLNVQGTSVANALTALRAATPLGTAVLTGHAGLKGG